jgi:Mg2+-importing ATPase
VIKPQETLACLTEIEATACDWSKAIEKLGSTHEEILRAYSIMPAEEAMSNLQSSQLGLSNEEVEARTKIVGENILSVKKPMTWWMILLSVLPNPFNILLVLIAVISVAAPPPQ